MKGISKKKYKDMNLYDLICCSQENDYDALEELIKREQKNIYASFCYLGASKENISDLTQEALFRMSKNIKNLKNPKLFKSWLGQIVTNLFYDELRKKQRIPDSVSIDSYWLHDDENDDCVLHICDNKLKPDETTIGKELTDVIREMICRLPEHFRVVIILRELQGLSYEEIAKITKTNVGTVKSRISRARNKLQECLKPYVA
ncbi:MAG: sigma-70 family RNA polymerase sigma factor [Candidatus Gastranaerophilales bacterium]|nr:sigma-70 family RNA polymerase sigma factor [Candidatus Gastranaerophilales bacterium]